MTKYCFCDIKAEAKAPIVKNIKAEITEADSKTNEIPEPEVLKSSNGDIKIASYTYKDENTIVCDNCKTEQPSQRKKCVKCRTLGPYGERCPNCNSSMKIYIVAKQ